MNIKHLVVKYVYGDHNLLKSVAKTINSLLNELPDDGIGLNVGAGKTNLDSRTKNLDLDDGPNIDKRLLSMLKTIR